MTAGGVARWMSDRLTAHFGAVRLPLPDPVETLVLTILSQNTTDRNRDRAYATFRRQFPALEAAAQANPEHIENSIHIAGLQKQKAQAIQTAVQRVLHTAGDLSLDFLRPQSTQDAMAWLLDLPGVGEKTAGIVVLFALRKPFFPIDTHIRRVLLRVGLVGKGQNLHRTVNAILPPDVSMMIGLHLHTIELGRTICRPRHPRCAQCPLEERCQHACATTAAERERNGH